MSRVPRESEPRPEPERPAPPTEPRRPVVAPQAVPPKTAKVVRVGKVGMNRNVAIIAGVLLLAVVLVLARTAGKKDTQLSAIPFEPVSLRDISLTVEATGTVEPVDLVDLFRAPQHLPAHVDEILAMPPRPRRPPRCRQAW